MSEIWLSTPHRDFSVATSEKMENGAVGNGYCDTTGTRHKCHFNRWFYTTIQFWVKLTKTVAGTGLASLAGLRPWFHLLINGLPNSGWAVGAAGRNLAEEHSSNGGLEYPIFCLQNKVSDLTPYPVEDL